MGIFDNMNPDDRYLMEQGYRVYQPRFGSSVLDSIGNAVQGVKQAMANQGARNVVSYLGGEGYSTPTNERIISQTANDANQLGFNLKNSATLPMAIPALGGAMGTGMLMAGGVGAGLGATTLAGLRAYLQTMNMQEQGRQSMAYASALERAQGVAGGILGKGSGHTNQTVLPYIPGL